MSKILIVYYSLTGSTRFIAETLNESLEADRLELKPIKELNPDKGSKFMSGGAQSTMKKKPELEPIEINPVEYDLIVIGTPVWAWNFTPPIRSFLSQFDFTGKKVALWTCSAGSGNRAMRKLKDELEEADILGHIQFQFKFKDPLDQDLTDYKTRAKEWASELKEKLD
ncbi:MAG: flavodoxin family protein [Promethearchaeota archaeon]|jgi:flavodoxin